MYPISPIIKNITLHTTIFAYTEVEILRRYTFPIYKPMTPNVRRRIQAVLRAKSGGIFSKLVKFYLLIVYRIFFFLSFFF